MLGYEGGGPHRGACSCRVRHSGYLPIPCRVPAVTAASCLITCFNCSPPGRRAPPRARRGPIPHRRPRRSQIRAKEAAVEAAALEKRQRQEKALRDKAEKKLRQERVQREKEDKAAKKAAERARRAEPAPLQQSAGAPRPPAAGA